MYGTQHNETDLQDAVREHHCLRQLQDSLLTATSPIAETYMMFPIEQLIQVQHHTFTTRFMVSGENILAL